MASRNRGVPKPKLRDLSRQPPSKADLEALYDTFRATHPTAAAVLGASIVEIELESALRSQLPRKGEVTWEAMTDDKGPLGTFYAKIELGWGMRLYDNDMRQTLHIIRAIRNAFAHAKTPLTFEHPLILKELASIPPYNRGRNRVKLRKDHVVIIKESLTNGSQKFVCLVYAISIAFLRGHTSRITAKISRRERQTLTSKGQQGLLGLLLTKDFPQSFQLDQSADPRTAAPASNPLILPAEAPPKRRSKHIP